MRLAFIALLLLSGTAHAQISGTQIRPNTIPANRLNNPTAWRSMLSLTPGVNVPDMVGTGAGGTWGISITGGAATATSANTATEAGSLVDGVHTITRDGARWLSTSPIGGPGFTGPLTGAVTVPFDGLDSGYFNGLALGFSGLPGATTTFGLGTTPGDTTLYTPSIINAAGFVGNVDGDVSGTASGLVSVGGGLLWVGNVNPSLAHYLFEPPVRFADEVVFEQGVTAQSYAGSGGGLTDLNASNLGSGTVPPERLASGFSAAADGAVPTKSGAGLVYAVPAGGGSVVESGTNPGYAANADTAVGLPAALTGIADSLLTANVPLKDAANTFTAAQSFGVAAGFPLALGGASGNLIAFSNTAATQKWHLAMSGNNLNIVESSVADGRLFLKAGGNVGIGTTGPTYSLHVAPTAGATAGQTAMFMDATATTGATKVVVKAGAGQGATYQTEWQSAAGGVVAGVLAGGGIYSSQFFLTPYVADPATSGTAAKLTLAATGVQVSRNTADANPALTVTQTHASSTGNITNFANNTGTVASVSQAGVSDMVAYKVNGSAGTAGQALVSNGTTGAVFQTQTYSMQAALDGGGSTLLSGNKAVLEIVNAGTLRRVTLIGDQVETGLVRVRVYRATLAAYAADPDPTDGTMAGWTLLGTLGLDNAITNQDATLAGWTTSLPADSVILLNVQDAAADLERLTVALKVEES